MRLAPLDVVMVGSESRQRRGSGRRCKTKASCPAVQVRERAQGSAALGFEFAAEYGSLVARQSRRAPEREQRLLDYRFGESAVTRAHGQRRTEPDLGYGDGKGRESVLVRRCVQDRAAQETSVRLCQSSGAR